MGIHRQTAKRVPSFAVGLQRVWPRVEPTDRSVTGKPLKESKASAVVRTQGPLGTSLLQAVYPANRALQRGQRDGKRRAWKPVTGESFRAGTDGYCKRGSLGNCLASLVPGLL